MTVMARRFRSIPQRTAGETWRAISELLAPQLDSESRSELAAIAGIASSLITREAMTSPIVIHGAGPRVRVYCLYNEEAIEGDEANENPLGFDATNGDWRISLPCPAEDLAWVQDALGSKSRRITARDMDESIEESERTNKSATVDIDMEAFFQS